MEIIIYITGGLVAGLLISWIITRYIWNSKVEAKNAEINELNRKNSSLEARVEAQANSIEEVRNAMLNTFKAAASDALVQNNKQFLDLAKTHLEAQIKAAEGNLDERKSAIDEMLKPVRESIDIYRKRIEELEKGSKETFGQVTEMLSGLRLTSASLQKETGALVNALRNPRVRGRWGEIGLKRVVEFSGMSEHCDFVEQVFREGEDSALKPDMIINLPGNSHVVVDSKLPLDAYLDALETDDESLRTKLFEKHARDLRDHVNKLSKKQYWSQFENSPDFVILYMEVESAFNVALMTDKSLLQDAMNNKIILTTPTTLIVVLKSVAMSWQQHNITENAMQIMNAASELYSRVNVFAEHFDKVGNGLKAALKGFNDAAGSWESRVVPAGRKLEQLGATDKKGILPDFDVIDNPVREIKKPKE
ncbi:MAG TPA: DNA recombination protein RmuC [Bacteroidales bacterium]|jgi:DNA recombination protein RmuC|nr:MAG: DNA recombination protein RmuC [Bacteroidetes bacterium ADurb.Bin145]HOU02764.1 DNA recombination protein RmuC [Bacteroidales bacterium]HQG63552.1 DNA recombination protein RmuC [Bacteroidales bacterium]HQK67983.1 DNA recombination protein RmuC [Bacteroidales bacterium]